MARQVDTMSEVAGGRDAGSRKHIGLWLVVAVLGLMVASLFLAGAADPKAAPAAEPANDANERALLETFRREFVEITPGAGQFPASFEMGRARRRAGRAAARIA